MTNPKPDIHAFLRGYFHLKSADWAGNTPHPLKSWTATELAQMPPYYIMPLESSMRTAVADAMDSEDAETVARLSARWLPDEELAVYADEWARNSFQGGLNWYRVGFEEAIGGEVALFAGKKIEVPALYVAGRQDWGTYQVPGAVEGLESVCADFRGVRFVEGAGHWVQQERHEELVGLMVEFLGSLGW